jgi:hypothetical protein
MKRGRNQQARILEGVKVNHRDRGLRSPGLLGFSPFPVRFAMCSNT